MSRFYGTLEGSGKTAATRTGHASTGITAHPRGWNVGVRVDAKPDAERHDRDSFEIVLTGGSNGGRFPFVLAEITEEGESVRVSVPTQDGGRSVFYVDRSGAVASRV